MSRKIIAVLACGALAAAASACGSSSGKSSAGAAPAHESSTGGEAGSGAGALAAEAQSAATGDIPDTQVFLTYHNAAGGYAMSYPEGWEIKANGADVTISEKNDLVRVALERAPPPSTASVSAQLARLKSSTPSLTFSAPRAVKLTSGPAIKVTYTTRSAANPVTGKSVLLVVDRYELSKGARRAIVDLGTPQGVDNVDAYRMMINSFRWQ